MAKERLPPHQFFRERVKHYQEAEAAGAIIFSIERAKRRQLAPVDIEYIMTVAAAENCSMRVALGALLDFYREYKDLEDSE
jgi:hypothetical protein